MKKQINHIWNIMSKRQNILQANTSFFISSTGKLKACRSSKLNVSRSYFIVDDNHVKIIWLHGAVFSEHDIVHF